MSEKINLTCIGCPLGCQITVTKNGDEIEDITGYTCKRGLEYAKTEVISPVRTITSTVRVTGGAGPVVSVKTATPIPKGMIDRSMEIIYGLEVQAPVAIGDVVCDNIAGTQVALVATSACAAE
ncbi:MAG: DUF1667 domain-containing protein [Lachnospiraceae bacterium]|nr:DUF1667 domain-containing protein [Lachnospiraceae bacterium]